jgi:hypothetical protein
MMWSKRPLHWMYKQQHSWMHNVLYNILLLLFVCQIKGNNSRRKRSQEKQHVLYQRSTKDR